MWAVCSRGWLGAAPALIPSTGVCVEKAKNDLPLGKQHPSPSCWLSPPSQRKLQESLISLFWLLFTSHISLLFCFFLLHHQLLESKRVEKNRWGLCYMSDVLIIATTTSNPIAPGSNLGKAV